MRLTFLSCVLFVTLWTIALAEAGSSLNFARCYSLCGGCELFPSNCKMCSSSLIFLNNQCVTNSRQSVLSAEFFPIEPSNPNSLLSTKGIENPSNLLDNCTYLDIDANNKIVGRVPFYFITQATPFTKLFNASQLPAHRYINIKFVLLFKDWSYEDSVDLVINNEVKAQFTYDPVILGEKGGVACQDSITQVKTFEYSIADESNYLNMTFDPKLNGIAKYGFNSLLIRYGNCQSSCEQCTGSTANSCVSCRSFLIWTNSICNTCESQYYYRENSCWYCDFSCSTCSGPTGNDCLSCDPSIYNLDKGKCIPKDPNFIEFAHDFQEVLFTTNSNWVLSTRNGQGSDVSICGKYSYLGGYQIGSSATHISKVFNDLPVHYAVKIQLLFIAIDSNNTEVGYDFYIDGQVKHTFVPMGKTRTNQCGTTTTESLLLVKLQTVTHSNSTLSFKLQPDIDSSSSFGIRDFVLFLYKCSPGCLDCTEDASVCKECGGNLILENNHCNNCAPSYYRVNSSYCSPCNILCKECTGPLANECQSCDAPLILSGTQCIQDSGYQIFGVYLNQKTDKVNPNNDWNIYPNLQNRGNDKCANYSMLGNSELRYKNLQMIKLFDELPKHTALSIHFTVFQIDQYSPKTLNFIYDGVEVKFQPAAYGIRLCGNDTRDAIKKVTYSTSHTSPRFAFHVIINEIAKVGIANMIIFLKDCAQCKGQLEYKINYMPVYDSSKKGLNVWIDFNFRNKNLTQINSIFSTSLGPKFEDVKVRLLAQTLPFNFTVQSVRRDSFKLFTKPNQSFIDSYLKITTNSPSLILSNNNKDEGVQKPLITTSAERYVTRYDVLPSNRTRRSMNNMYNFNYGFTNAVFYISLVLFAFGLSVLLEDFVHLLQIVFLYIFIASSILPTTLKYPLSGMKRIQFLNFFSEANRKSIETWFLPRDFYQDSHHVFQQYQPDVNFLRAIYALIIFNLFYILFWLLGSLLTKNVKVLRDKSYNPYLRYFQDIWCRPFAFFDAILRYQFIAITWAALLQFTNFTSPYIPYSGINAFFTIALFIGFFAYPICIFLYLRTQYSYMTNQQFQFLYSDCFYKRMIVDQSPQQNPHPFIYLLFKNYWYLLVCLVICLTTIYESNIGALAAMLVLISLDFIWIFVFRIFTDKALQVFKAIEDVLLLFLTILYFVVNGQADSMPTTQFLHLGFGCEAIVIMIVMNASIRTVYLVYLRAREFREYKHQLRMSAIENSYVNDAQKQLLKSRSKILGSKIAASSNNMILPTKKTMKVTPIKDVSQMGSRVTSLNQFVIE